MAQAYAALWCKTNYSFLQAASHPEELVQRAQHLGLPALAVTDLDGVHGVVRAYAQAKASNYKLLMGSQVSVDTGHSLVLLATSRHGYAQLCRLLTLGRLRCAKGSSQVSWSDVCAHSTELLALWDGACPEQAELLRAAFGDRLYGLVARHYNAHERGRELRLRELAQRLAMPLVAANEVLYHDSNRQPLHDVLTCIRHGVSLEQAGRKLKPNAHYNLKSPAEFELLFRDAPEMVRRTLEVAERCQFSMGELRYRYPSENLGAGLTTMDYLRQLADIGAQQRYPSGVPAQVAAQIARELDLVEELEYAGYFLTMYEIVQYCRAHAIVCQGRGSAANSALCYCLGITAIDPTRIDLLFERFISRERAEPPDIDLDIQHNRREEVIQWVYAKYGRSHAAMVANVIRYRTRSALRDVGKALGIGDTSLERLTRLTSHREAQDDSLLVEAGLDPAHRRNQLLLQLAAEIRNFPRHLSIHPGGFLLGHEPVHDFVPIENATREGRTVIQWDKDDIETLGLFKVDLLALGALSQLDICFRLLRENYGREVSIQSITASDDPATYAMIAAGDTVGVFQIESRAQMAMLPRLKPRTFYDLVIEVSIVRPGPISGGMVHPYLRRRNGEEPVVYPHPSLEPVLGKTLGVPLFQEQVMKLAVVAADYTPGEADQLRRDMAAWRQAGRIEGHRQTLIERMQAKGIAVEFAERVFEQIRGFGEYGFPESHAASFALIAYATSYLRCHYPAEFTCGLLNAQPMGFYSAATIVDDAKRHGVEIRPVDVAVSAWDCTLEKYSDDSGVTRYAVRMGLRYIHGLSREQGEQIQQQARQSASLETFVTRSRLPVDVLTRLAEAGAYDCWAVDRRTALWLIPGYVLARADVLRAPAGTMAMEFAPLNGLEQVSWDYQASGHSPRGHQLSYAREALRTQRVPSARQLPDLAGKNVRYAGIVICRQRPGTAKGVTFLTLEDETGFVNVVIWKDVFAQYGLQVRTTSFLGVEGLVESQQGVCHIIARSFWAPQLELQPEVMQSRDFH